MTASLDEAYKQAENRGFTNKGPGKADWDDEYSPWKFVDGKASSSPTVKKIDFGFWEDYTDYDVTWEYDQETNTYSRKNGGKDFVDGAYDNMQITTENVVVMFVVERSNVDRNRHLLYTTIGSGKALIFQNGEMIEGSWEKDSRGARTLFYDESDDELSFVRGNIWIEVVPKGNKVQY